MTCLESPFDLPGSCQLARLYFLSGDCAYQTLCLSIRASSLWHGMLVLRIKPTMQSFVTSEAAVLRAATWTTSEAGREIQSRSRGQQARCGWQLSHHQNRSVFGPPHLTCLPLSSLNAVTLPLQVSIPVCSPHFALTARCNMSSDLLWQGSRDGFDKPSCTMQGLALMKDHRQSMKIESME